MHIRSMLLKRGRESRAARTDGVQSDSQVVVEAVIPWFCNRERIPDLGLCSLAIDRYSKWVLRFEHRLLTVARLRQLRILPQPLELEALF